MAESKNIKVNELEIGARLRDEDRLLVLVDDVNNEVKTIAKENVITSLISNVENNLLTNNGGLFVDGNAFNELLEILKLIKERQADEIGRPIPTFSNTLLDDEIWLEGDLVSTTDEEYAQIVEVYGTTYNKGNEPEGFIRLPDCRNRVFWGASNFGYIEAALPDIDGTFSGVGNINSSSVATLTGGFYRVNTAQNPSQGVRLAVGSHTDDYFGFQASRSNPIYGKSNTVQPPAIKVRVKTRFK